MNNICPNCLKEKKVVLVDLNLFNERRKRIRFKFKRCQKNKNKDFCLTLLLSKIVIRI